MSTLPARLQQERTDLEHPAVHRSTAAAELLTKYTTQRAEQSDGSDSEREVEDEELAQNSDSAVGRSSKLKANPRLTSRWCACVCAGWAGVAGGGVEFPTCALTPLPFVYLTGKPAR